ncbi:MAG: heme-binding protein [Planctomycetes bacterium]|nr:heme-binding protein [Planctomycetota bacterium]
MRAMVGIELVVLLSLLAAAATTAWAGGDSDTTAAARAEGETKDSAPPLAPGTSRRVAGDLQAQVEKRGDGYFFGPCSVDAPLPAGYPAPTPPGAIELKHYPMVRRAEVTGSSHPDAGRWLAFWPLFNHIKSRDIAMTAPVEVDYQGLTSDTQPERWTMAFLYRLRSQGEEGRVGMVAVRDVPATKVVAMGVRGAYGLKGHLEPLRQLEQWLRTHPEFKQAGPPRALFYNGPSKRSADRWCEVQIPIREVTAVQASPKRAGVDP